MTAGVASSAASGALSSGAASGLGEGLSEGLGDGLSEAGELLGDGGDDLLGDGRGNPIGDVGDDLLGDGNGDPIGDGSGDPLGSLSPDPNAPALGAGDGVDDFTPDEVNQLGNTITDGIENANERKESMLSSATITIGSANIEMGSNGNVGSFGGLQGMEDAEQGMLEDGDGLDELEKEKRSLTSQQGSLTRKINALDKEEQQLLPSDEEWMYGAHFENGMEGDEEDDDRSRRLREVQQEKAGLIAQRDDVISRKEEVGEQISAIRESSGEKSQLSENSSGSGAITSGAGNKQGIGNISAGNITINAGSVNMQGGENIKFAGEGQVKGADGEKQDNTKLEEYELVDDGITLQGASLSAGEIFKNIGGLEKLGQLGVDLYQGLGGIGDGLYVDGDAPTKERETIAGMLSQNIKDSSEKRKENNDRMKDNWANNKSNISIMTEKYMSDEKFREKYSDKPEAYIRREAETKAKSALKDMSAYVPYGITDVNLAYELYDSANKNGFTPEQAIRNKAGYEKFNNNVQNVVSINQSGTFERDNYKTVEEAIPDARKYYDAGYTDINDMAWVEKIAQSLGRSPEFAMKVDQTLRKKGGKINYNGKNEEMKKLIADINSAYGG